MSIFRKKPDEQITIEVTPIKTAAEAINRHRRFVDLCMQHRMSIVSTSGKTVTLSGRPKNVARFRLDHAALQKAGLV